MVKASRKNIHVQPIPKFENYSGLQESRQFVLSDVRSISGLFSDFTFVIDKALKAVSLVIAYNLTPSLVLTLLAKLL